MAEVSEIEAGGEVRTVKDTTARKALVYSTDETDTGKKWIDGKPIYRRVIREIQKNFPYHSFTKILYYPDYSIDTLVDINAIMTKKDTYDIFKGFAYGVNWNNDGISVYQNFSGGATAQTSYYLVIEYTKTTD